MNRSHIFTVIAGCLYLASCSTTREIQFSNETWTFSHMSGNVVNADSTLQFTFGDHVIDPGMTMISNRDSLLAHKGADEYIARLLQVCSLEGSRVLFFSPAENTMWVELPEQFTDIKPRAISYNLSDSLPRTLWVWEDDNREGNRRPEEIYSNTFADKKNGTIIVADKMNYGNTPMACLHVFQTATGRTDKLGFTPWHWTAKANLLDHSCDDILANWIDSRRAIVFDNYKLGQRVEYRRTVNAIREELKEILRLDQEPRNRIVAAWREHPQDTLLHRQIGRERWHNDSVNLIRVCDILDRYSLDFGEENEVLWAVIQHSTLELQQKYLPSFIEAANAGKLKGELVAVMQDRVACWSGRPQIYGSQGNLDDNGVFVPADIADKENVDARRTAMGMCPLQEYIARMSTR